jgi:hypothetical protein
MRHLENEYLGSLGVDYPVRAEKVAPAVVGVGDRLLLKFRLGLIWLMGFPWKKGIGS